MLLALLHLGLIGLVLVLVLGLIGLVLVLGLIGLVGGGYLGVAIACFFSDCGPCKASIFILGALAGITLGSSC